MAKTILITGASSGIGRATVFKFQKEGWNVLATMRKPENEKELNQLDNVHVLRLDVQDLESIETAVREGIAQFGKIDVVLNNAGYGLMGTFESASRKALPDNLMSMCLDSLMSPVPFFPISEQTRVGPLSIFHL